MHRLVYPGGWGSRLRAVLLGIGVAAVFAIAAAPARAEPPLPEKNKWRGPCYNCYNYAANRKTVFFAQPPIGGALNCANTAAAARANGLLDDTNHPGGAAAFWEGPADGAMPAGWPAGQCPAGYCLVALVVDPGNDYHWYRLNGDGSWSHKPGQTPATCKDAGGAAMGAANPPHVANVAPYTFCKYMCMPAPPAAWGAGGLPPWTFGQLLRAWKLRKDGLYDLFRDITDVSGTLSRLPTLVPVADPLWDEQPQLANKGYALLRSASAPPQFPPYLRVYNGVVAYYSDLNGDENTVITYYADDRGLGSFLDAQVSASVPTVSEWGMIVLGGVLLIAGFFVIRRMAT